MRMFCAFACLIKHMLYGPYTTTNDDNDWVLSTQCSSILKDDLGLACRYLVPTVAVDSPQVKKTPCDQGSCFANDPRTGFSQVAWGHIGEGCRDKQHVVNTVAPTIQC